MSDVFGIITGSLCGGVLLVVMGAGCLGYNEKKKRARTGKITKSENVDAKGVEGEGGVLNNQN